MTLSFNRLLVILPISLLLLAGCGDNGGDDTASGDNGSESSDSADGGGGDEGSTGGGLDESTDLCSLVSDETLAASNLSPADGVQKEWVYGPSCVYGENLDRRIIVQVDFDNALGPIEEGDEGVEEMNGRPVEVGFDSEMTCLYTFDVDDDTKVDVIVEDLYAPERTPGEPCDAGRPALDDVMEKTS